ncbi:procollagen-lysine,2-oxoglutarate 5-dioxygenase 1-like [Penaeus japonicus]|uniref:procollagen-lysine,2-oxoglutarate 5-dioxygenase 1-like n=1 Tax=Penaeus japonicus TaxID=27405 RepID=UPI001C715BFB|nr:procollagen-lysine,2-oxoglutarate 5-dioxygenase 1-like [Penaeus japonicus]
MNICSCFQNSVRRYCVLFLVPVLFLCLCVVSGESYLDPKIRVLILTGATPRDGHLRFFRSLKSADFPVQIVRTEGSESEISTALETIRTYNQDEALILTNSDQFLAVQGALAATWTVIGEAARQEASVLMSFPALPKVMSYDVHEEMERVLKDLQSHREFERSGVKPRGAEGLATARKLLKKLQHLTVRGEQDQRQAKPDIKSFRAFAFAGLASSVKNLLEGLEAKYHQGSLGTLWRVLAESPGLRRRHGVALDYRYVAFQKADTGNFGFRERLEGKPIVHTAERTLPPFLYGSPTGMPFSLANMAVKEVTFKFLCDDCPDEPLSRPQVLGEGEEPPSVKVAVFVEDRVPFFRLFLRHLGRLSYPKDRVTLFVYLSEAAAHHVDELEEFLEVYEMEYQDVGVAYPELQIDSARAHRFLWLEAGKSKEDYLFMVDASVQLTNPDVLQDLMRKRRSIVGPVLAHADGSGHNLMTEYINREFSEGPFAENFVTRFRDENGTVDLVGMLQVAKITGALLLNQDAFLTIKKASFTSSGDDMWNRFFLHVFEQGYIPTPVTRRPTAYLTKKEKNKHFTPDIWNLERNQEDFVAYFTFLQTPKGLEVFSGEGECEGVVRRWLFRGSFAQDLMALVDGEPKWEDDAGKSDTVTALVPPEGHARKAGQALAKFAVRSIVPQFNETQASSVGELRVLKGFGSYSLDGASFVVLTGLSKKTTSVEIHSAGDEKCHLALQKGEAAFFRSATYSKLTLPLSVTLALMSL